MFWFKILTYVNLGEYDVKSITTQNSKLESIHQIEIRIILHYILRMNFKSLLTLPKCSWQLQ